MKFFIQRYYLLFFILLLFISCEEDEVTFTEPQPNQTGSLKEIPINLTGKYFDDDNNVELNIYNKIILKTFVSTDTFNINELSEDEIIKNDSLFNKKSFQQYLLKKINDSLFSGYRISDTIFNLERKDLLKKYKGFYFLNYFNSENNWSVNKLSYRKGIININGITTENEIKILEDITQTNRDTLIPYIASPTRKQFKEFIKQNGFTKGETYIKKQ